MAEKLKPELVTPYRHVLSQEVDEVTFKYYSIFYPVESSDSQKFSHVIYVRNTTELLQLLNYWNSKDSRWKCFCDLDEIPY